MKLNIKDVLKFLFPEWQIIQTINKHGFIRTAQREQPGAQKQLQRAVPHQAPQAAVMNSTPPPMPVNKPTPVPASQTAVYTHKDKTKVNQSGLTAQFDAIRKQLGREIIGQSNYLDELCLAFKRPFVTGADAHKPKNVIFILGNRGTGKLTTISAMAKLLKERKLMTSDVVLTMDLSLYATQSDFQLFITDLYKCLYGQSDLVLFENYDKAHSSVIDVVSELSTTGKYGLRSRYLFQNNHLVEATGMLVQDSISELSANSKFFVFTSDQNKEKIFDVFGSRFMDSVKDILYTEPFSDAEMYELTRVVLEAMKRRCMEQLSFTVSWDESLVSLVASAYKNEEGVNSLEDFVQHHIFLPLGEYHLAHPNAMNELVFLSAQGKEVMAQINAENVALSGLMPQSNNTGLEEVKEELAKIVGVDSVKQYILQLEDNLQVQKMREEAGFAHAQVSMHMIFTGNPGTGKTTIARITAKYLKALGVLSTGQLREVTRADLVGQYVGETARLTSDVLKSALGGVLFIDEAYALCRDKHDTFGLEAIDALVKGMEDYRDDLVVILAGYSDEMDSFLKVNPGLKSRFPNVIEFEDYSAEEMWEIANIIAQTKGYQIDPGAKEGLIRLFEKRQIKGRNDSGNGRLVRNVIEAAILSQSKRLMTDRTAAMDVLAVEDFKFEDTSSFDLEASLAPIIGLDNVKEFIRTQHKLLVAQEKRRQAGLFVDTSQSLNMIFSGNPGTGKTTVARIMANMFKEMGLLKSGHLIETDRGGLVAEYAGQTAKKTEEVFRSALGGVLFIDEAYALAADGGSFGMEAINTLVKMIEDYQGEIVVVLAGYKKEMKEFMKSNSGLESRFPLKIDFPDYSAEELYEIGLKIISDKGFTIGEEAKEMARKQLALMHRQASTHSGNGRMVRNYVEEIMRNQSARIATEEVAAEEMNVIIPSDIQPNVRKKEDFDLETELATIVGLDEVKDYIRSLNAKLRIQKEREKLGLIVDDSQTMHMIFKGNPGTGKTMVARTVANVLYNIGVIQTNKLIETDRSGLVAGYVGQTAMKTREVVMDALDGVLFIDEAYALAQGGANDFGREAIDTLVKLMDDYRDRLVVILAGYNEDMDEFLATNAGLKSRFPNIIEFKDYDIDELMEISELFFRSKGYELDDSAKFKLKYILVDASKEHHFGNGRYVRNIYEKAVNNQAMRLDTDLALTKAELITITDLDIERV